MDLYVLNLYVQKYLRKFTAHTLSSFYMDMTRWLKSFLMETHGTVYPVYMVNTTIYYVLGFLFLLTI